METLRPGLESFDSDLSQLYEYVPDSVVEQGQVLLCGHCGWTLARTRGRLRCGDDRCRLLTANFTRGTTSRPAHPDLLRVNKAIRRYVVAPGRHEIAAYNRLGSMGVAVELWPAYDRYDLRITFSEEEAWAVDIKDWRYPHLLARHLEPLTSDGGSAPTRSFYAIPDDRVQDNPGYLTFLRSANASQEFEVCTISDLIENVRMRRQVTNAQR